jgi:signal transduction histidine kinase
VSGVKLLGRDPPAPLNVFGTIAMTAIVVISIFSEPQPGVSGDGPWVALSIAALVAGIAVSLPRFRVARARRVAGLVLVVVAMCALVALQPEGIAFGALYYVVIVAALELSLGPGLLLSGVAVAAVSVVIGLRVEEPAGAVISIAGSVVPWFLVMRLVSQLHAGRVRAEQLVEELRESRAAHAESAAVAERGRMARDLHDVLAHSLSALALQLEGARLLATDRGSDPEVVEAIESAHHLAADGLAEARDSSSSPAPTRARAGSRPPAHRTSCAPRRGSRSTGPPRRRSPTSSGTAPPNGWSCRWPTSPGRPGWWCRITGAGRRSRSGLAAPAAATA